MSGSAPATMPMYAAGRRWPALLPVDQVRKSDKVQISRVQTAPRCWWMRASSALVFEFFARGDKRRNSASGDARPTSQRPTCVSARLLLVSMRQPPHSAGDAVRGPHGGVDPKAQQGFLRHLPADLRDGAAAPDARRGCGKVRRAQHRDPRQLSRPRRPASDRPGAYPPVDLHTRLQRTLLCSSRDPACRSRPTSGLPRTSRSWRPRTMRVHRRHRRRGGA